MYTHFIFGLAFLLIWPLFDLKMEVIALSSYEEKEEQFKEQVSPLI